MYYLLIEHIQVRGFQMLQTPTIATPVPLFAASMLAHAIVDRARGSGVAQSKTTGIALIVHETFLHAETVIVTNKNQYPVLSAHIKRGACGYLVGKAGKGGDYASNATSPASMAQQPLMQASGRFSLLIQCDDVNFGDLDTTLRQKLLRMRLAGGYIDKIGRITGSHEMPTLPLGKVVMDASSLIQSRLDAGENIVQAMMNSMYFNPDVDDDSEVSVADNDADPDHDQSIEGTEPADTGNAKKARRKAPPPPLRVPVTVGYALLGELKQRQGARLAPATSRTPNEVIPAAPAEPMCGLTELITTRQAEKEGRDVLWRFGWKHDHDIDYCILQQHTFHPSHAQGA